MADDIFKYEIVIDDSKLDKDLERVQDKISKSNTQLITVADNTAKEIGNGYLEVSTALVSSTNSLDQVMDKSIIEAERYQNVLVNVLNNNYEVSYEIRADDSKLEEDLDKANEKVNKKADKNNSKLMKVAGKAAKAIGAGFLEVSMFALNSADDMDKAMNGFIASTGKGVEETERYQNVLENIYANNYGENFQDIADKMLLVNQQMGDLDDSQMQKIVESGYLLQDTFGIGMTESIRGADAMMEQFGISGEDAYNLIAQGAQQGLNQNGDLADQLAEYSGYYADIGYSAEEMMNIIASGAIEGGSQMNYLNEAVKEFGVKSKDGSKESAQAFEALGFNAEEMTEKFMNGGTEAKEAFEQINEALINMDDTVLQNQAGVALYGTQFEEMGIEAVLAMQNAENSINSTTDALGAIEDIKYDSLGEMFEGLKRNVEMLLLPLGEMLIPILGELIETILPLIQENLPIIIELVLGVVDSLLPIIEELLPVLVQLFQELAPQIIPLVETILPVLAELFTRLLPPLIEIIEKLLPPLLSLIDALLPIFLQLIDLFMIVVDLFIEFLDPIIDLIDLAILPLIEAIMPLVTILADLLIPILDVLMAVFAEVFKGIAGDAKEQIKIVTDILNNIIDFVKNIFTGNWKNAWENIVNVFSGIVSGINNMFKEPINSLIDKINGFINGINKIKIPDWVPGIGGLSFKISNIPRLKVGMDYVPNDNFLALLHQGEAVLTAEEASVYRMLGGNLEGLLTQPNHNTGYYIDYDRLGQSTAANIKISGNLYTTVELDKREVGVAIAPIVSEELAWKE